MKPAWAPMLTSVALALSACGHSEPFVTTATGGEGSFDQVVPIQLTFSANDDAFPTYSRDGRWLSYRFARGSGDRDQCAGILPGTGGQRVEEICAWELDQATRTDDFRGLVFLANERMAFTRYRSGTGNQAPQEGGLYLGPRGREREATQVLGLLGRPPGASDTWTYLIDPIATGDNELTVLAARTFIGQRIPFGPIDTLIRGVEFARVNLATNPATITVIAPAPDAVSWQLDQNSGRIYYHRRYYTAPPGTTVALVAADSVFRVPVAGGAAEVVWGRAPVPLAMGELDLGRGMGGFGVGGGRLFVSVWDRRQPPTVGGTTPSPETRSRILEIAAGEEIPLRVDYSSSQTIWTQLSVAPDGRHLVAGKVTGGTFASDKTQMGSRDLFLFKLTP